MRIIYFLYFSIGRKWTTFAFLLLAGLAGIVVGVFQLTGKAVGVFQFTSRFIFRNSNRIIEVYRKVFQE
jgi:uncharacterized membrane protein YbhN (UPF0104 family)